MKKSSISFPSTRKSILDILFSFLCTQKYFDLSSAVAICEMLQEK